MEAANENRFELLLFHLGSKQRYGINVLKVKEVIGCPELTHVPESHPAVRGVSHLRGETLTIIDLSQSVGLAPLPESEDVDASVIVSEFNRVMIGFLVSKVDRIAVCDWKDVLPPPKGSGLGSYITGVTDIEKELVQILDVERIIGEVVGSEVVTAADLSLDGNQAALLEGKRIMLIDDSRMARHQINQTLNSVGIVTIEAQDGVEALKKLRQLSSDEGDNGAGVDMIISDIEMPEMDGYTFTRELRNDPEFSDSYVLLHTSLNGAINEDKATTCGANDILTKFVADELIKAVIKGLS